MRCALTGQAAPSTLSFIRTRSDCRMSRSGSRCCSCCVTRSIASSAGSTAVAGADDRSTTSSGPRTKLRLLRPFPPPTTAEALSVSEDRRRAEAVAAMRGIYHVKSSYADWLVDFDYLGSRRDDISWVGLTSRLADDFERLKQILGLPVECVLPADPVASHRRLDTDETCLSPVGIKNIEGWYAADYPFLTYFAAEAAGGIARGGS